MDTNFVVLADNNVRAVAVQADGKVLVRGDFNLVAWPVVSRPGIARFNANGSVDTNFNPQVSGSSDPCPLLVQPDGKILIGGELTSVNGIPRNGIARLDADGNLDICFDKGTIEY